MQGMALGRLRLRWQWLALSCGLLGGHPHASAAGESRGPWRMVQLGTGVIGPEVDSSIASSADFCSALRWPQQGSTIQQEGRFWAAALSSFRAERCGAFSCSRVTPDQGRRFAEIGDAVLR